MDRAAVSFSKRLVSIPFKSGRALQLKVGALEIASLPSFNPLQVGAGTSISEAFANLQRELDVSIPFKSGRALQFEVTCRQGCRVYRFNPLQVGAGTSILS